MKEKKFIVWDYWYLNNMAYAVVEEIQDNKVTLKLMWKECDDNKKL